ncbi:MAG: 4Fe-4S dicluster domain-containing protein, partial [Ruthenibacterium sp.]
TGGPMMGLAVLDTDFPVLKQNNAILALSEAEAHLPTATACIRCGRCIHACPMGLSPVEIATAYTQNNVEALNDLMVDLCISCGTCTYVCPAKRPVCQTMALAKIVQKNGGVK